MKHNPWSPNYGYGEGLPPNKLPRLQTQSQYGQQLPSPYAINEQGTHVHVHLCLK